MIFAVYMKLGGIVAIIVYTYIIGVNYDAGKAEWLSTGIIEMGWNVIVWSYALRDC